MILIRAIKDSIIFSYFESQLHVNQFINNKKAQADNKFPNPFKCGILRLASATHVLIRIDQLIHEVTCPIKGMPSLLSPHSALSLAGMKNVCSLLVLGVLSSLVAASKEELSLLEKWEQGKESYEN